MPYAADITIKIYQHRKVYWSIIYKLYNTQFYDLWFMKKVDDHKNTERTVAYNCGIQTEYYYLKHE